MTRKDYEAIAKVLRIAANDPGTLEFGRDNAKFIDHGDVASQLADVLQADNPRFDRDRFLKACGL